MDRERIRAWMSTPSDTSFSDAIALLRAYHLHDAEGLATVLENCDVADVLKACLSLYEISLVVHEIDPCMVLDSLHVAVVDPTEEPPEENRA